MSQWTTARLVAWREVRERMRSKELIISTGISLVILVLVVLVGAAGDDDGPSYEVGTVGERPVEVATVMSSLADGRGDDDGVDLDVTEVADRAEATRLLEDDDLDAVLVDGVIVVRDEIDGELEGLVQAAHRELAIADALADSGASREQVAAATPAPLTTQALEPDDDSEDRMALAMIGTLVLYVQLFGLGYWVASGIVEEKASRVVEVLLAKTRPSSLLAGKIVGIGVVGLAQLLVFVGVGLGLATTVGSIDLPSGTGRTAVGLVAWFLLGFALYACVFAMGGAVASRVEELQTTTGPIMLVVMGAFVAAVATVRDPEGPVAQVATFVPPAAPLVLPIRSAADAAAGWEMAVAVALVLATILVVVRIAARIYAGGALFTRGQLKLRDALARADD